MYDTQIMLHSDEADFRQKFFTKDRELRTQEITNEQMMEIERQSVDQDVSETFFGGMVASFDDLVALYENDMQAIEEETKSDVIKEEQLKVETEDPYSMKRFQEEESVFPKKRLEAKLANDPAAPRKPDGSTSTNNVINGSNSQRLGYNGGYNDPNYRPDNRTPTFTAGPKAGEKAHIMSHTDRAMTNAQNAAWNSPKFEDSVGEEGWEAYANKTWWQKAKSWVKGKNGRVMAKVTAFIVMQVGVALVSKKYVFDNWWQPVFFCSMMVGSFWMTKSLQKDGYDMRGLVV